MWRRAIVWQATLLLAGAWDLSYYTRSRIYPPVPTVECFEYPGEEWSSRHSGLLAAGRAGREGGALNSMFNSGIYSSTSFGMRRALSRRFDSFPYSFSKEDIVKEHAKLVRDINGLKQAGPAQVVLLADKSGDYDDSVYPEEIDPATTAASTPALPVLPIGGASHHAVAGAWRARQPYPLVSAVRVCLPPASRLVPRLVPRLLPRPAPFLYPKPTTNLLQTLLDGFLSK